MPLVVRIIPIAVAAWADVRLDALRLRVLLLVCVLLPFSVGRDSPAATSAAPAVVPPSVPLGIATFPSPVPPPAAVVAPALRRVGVPSPREAAAQRLAEL
jgi:hypothetical protein